FWAQRMLHLDLDGQYADVLERALYNGALSGLSRDGQHYFYANPLESIGTATRWAWHTCPCCTMNVARLIGSVGDYFLSHTENEIAFHLYGGISTSVALKSGKVTLRETSNYPWSGAIAIEVNPEVTAEFTINLRVPSWCKGAKATVNGKVISAKKLVKGYLPIKRKWAMGDKIKLTLPMKATRVYASPSVNMDLGRVALQRGPLVYCIEEVDNAGRPVQRLKLPRSSPLKVKHRADLFDGVVTLTAKAKALVQNDWKTDLYRGEAPRETTTTLTAIPYYLWSNRGQGSMVVWIPEA
ncbi:MAG: beta-L-arabinofuranosidase domain-containing protein, partial [Aestuariivirga sp.]